MEPFADVLLAEHREVDDLFAATLDAAVDEREHAFMRLLHALALHESVDHVVVHPQARQIITGGDELVDALMSEELAIRDALVELDRVPARDGEFVDRLTEIRRQVAEHNRREENDELPWLATEADPAEQGRLTRAADALRKLAATGSEEEYADADLAPGSPNMMVGPFATLLDRARQFTAPPPV
jgi:hypothetical protein